MTLRARLIAALLTLALLPTAVFTVFTLDQLGRSTERWFRPGVNRALESALEVSRTVLTRLEAAVLEHADDWAAQVAGTGLEAGSRSALRENLRGAGLDFIQTYRHGTAGWKLEDQVVTTGVLPVSPLDLGPELDAALASTRLLHSPRGALAGVARMDEQTALVAGIWVPPDFFQQVQRVGEGVSLYHRLGVVVDVQKPYVWLLVSVLVLLLAALAVALATALARQMSRPLAGLSAALERVSAGDLEVRVAPSGAQELRSLAGAFNTMTARLAEARGALQQAEREAAWREVARRLAHEFKNILTPMSLSLHRLQRRAAVVAGTDRQAVAESLDALSSGVDHLARLAEQFSQYARLPDPRFERLDLSEVARAAAALHEHEGIRVELQSGGALPIRGDSLLLSRAVHNLLLNACEASTPGSTVVIRTAAEGGRAVVHVLDRGAGIPAEIRHRVFEPYASTKRRGSGLGLSLVRDIAGQHQGAVSLDDREGGGAHARLSLPLLDTSDQEAREA